MAGNKIAKINVLLRLSVSKINFFAPRSNYKLATLYKTSTVSIQTMISSVSKGSSKISLGPPNNHVRAGYRTKLFVSHQSSYHCFEEGLQGYVLTKTQPYVEI